MALAGTGVGVGEEEGDGLETPAEGTGFLPQPVNNRPARTAAARNEVLKVTPSFYADSAGETNLFHFPDFPCYKSRAIL